MNTYEVRIHPEKVDGSWAICAERLELIGAYALAHGRGRPLKRITERRYLTERGFDATVECRCVRFFASQKEAQEQIENAGLAEQLPSQWQ